MFGVLTKGLRVDPYPRVYPTRPVTRGRIWSGTLFHGYGILGFTREFLRLREVPEDQFTWLVHAFARSILLYQLARINLKKQSAFNSMHLL